MERETSLTFRLGDTTWTCWVIHGGSYEWRSDCGRLLAWREGDAWVSKSDGHITQHPHPTLRSAMLDAQCEGLLRACGFRNAQREGELNFNVGTRWPLWPNRPRRAEKLRVQAPHNQKDHANGRPQHARAS